MAEVTISVEQCDQCPHAQIDKVWTEDSWDDVRKIYCKELKEEVYGYLDWYDKSPVPSNCRFNSK